MSLVSDAGSMRSSGLRLAISWLLVASRSSHARAATAGGAGASASATHDSEKRSKVARRRGMPKLYRALFRQNRLDLDIRAPRADVAELVRRGVGQVDDPARVERAAVVDADDDALPVREIGHARVARNRQDGVRPGHRVHVVALAARGALPVELPA